MFQTPTRKSAGKCVVSGVDNNDQSPEMDVLESPIPLSREEAANAEVRALAAKLAPAFIEADALFELPSEFRQAESFPIITDDDDDMDNELQNLQVSEAMLRQELDQDFSSLFETSQIIEDDSENEDQGEVLQQQSPFVVEADTDGDDASPEQAVDVDRSLTLPPIRIPSPTDSPAVSAPAPNNSTRSRSSLGSMTYYYRQRNPNVLVNVPTSAGGAMEYSISDHCQALGVQREERGGWYSIDWTRLFLQSEKKHEALSTRMSCKEYCLALSDAKIKNLFVGLSSSPSSSESDETPTLPLPVRTIALRIRPDVLCGAVMEAVFHAITANEGVLQAQIQKRQGGHIQAIILGAVVSEQPEKVYDPFFVDMQLVTCKSDVCERTLLVRIYHRDSQHARTDEDLEAMVAQYTALEEPLDTTHAYRLREAAALIQRIEAPEQAKRIRVATQSSSKANLREAVSQHLLEHYRACPSVKNGSVTLPSLNPDDFPIVESSCRLVDLLWEELETRELSYSTLATTSFGAFPALPTLDVHYCSQIRRISRERMIGQLLKSATELEEFAREAEFACANMIQLLQPAFESYGVEAPALPKPVPLTAYPLQFTPSQTTCPPWGQRVQHALDKVQAMVSENQRDESAFQLAESAVRFVFEAFQKQDDDEQSARLERKNVQVMDRLAKMQAHQRASIQRIQFAQTEKALQAAQNFHSKTGIREVPLLCWSIVVGSSTGTGTITANNILFMTKLIPVIGGNTIRLFDLKEVDFEVQETTSSLSLHPLTTTISVKQRGHQGEAYSFRPNMGGSRLKMFVDIVKQAGERF